MSVTDSKQQLSLENDAPSGDALPYSLELELTVKDPDVVAELVTQEEGPAREDFALSALRIGVLAMRQARGQIDGEAIRRESDRLLTSLDGQLGEHARLVHGRVTECLKEYFDPESGRFQERVNRLVQKDGELEKLLRDQIGGEDSQLARTLVEHFGQNSPLMQWLSPDESRGLLAALRQTLGEQLRQQREQVLDQFSLDNKQGALSKLVQELSDNQGKLTDKLEQRIDSVVEEFSLDREDSALSRLVRNVDRAQRTITAEFSLDNEQSALSRLQKMLETTNQAIHSQLTLDEEDSSLARLKRELLEILDRHGKTNRDFQESVTKTLAQLVARREEADRSTRHGLEFQDAVFEFVSREAQRAGDHATFSGNTTGLIQHCKVGDVVVELGPECATPGARIVLEAKQERGRNVEKARAEIETARKNRDAQVGIFVFSAKTSPGDLEPLLRYGNDVFVRWDAEDQSSDVFLRGGLSVARALCVRQGRSQKAQTDDFQTVDKAVRAVEKQAQLLEEVLTSTDTIEKANDKIRKRATTCRKQLFSQVERLDGAVEALKDAAGPAVD